jgi:hypothetical protein
MLCNTAYINILPAMAMETGCSNGRIIADSAEGYWNQAGCMAGINLVAPQLHLYIRCRRSPMTCRSLLSRSTVETQTH